MSINSLEMALWQSYIYPADTERFRSEPEAYLRSFDLDDNERTMALNWDVVGQINYGVNPLLMMMAWQAVRGLETFGTYLGLVNGMAAPAPAA